MSVQRAVGLRLKELRLKKNLSQEKLAYELEMDRTYIASVENGKRNISIKNLEKIWTFFQLSPKDFFDSDLFYKDIQDGRSRNP